MSKHDTADHKNRKFSALHQSSPSNEELPPPPETSRPTEKPKEVHRKEKNCPKFTLTQAQRADIKEAFDLFDKEGSGCIDVKELKVAYRALGFEPKKEELRHLIASVDTKETGKLEFSEFLLLVCMKMAEKDTFEDVMKAFRLFDDDEKGFVTIQNLERVSTELGENLAEDELQEMMEFADRKGSGQVSQEEFIKVMNINLRLH